MDTDELDQHTQQLDDNHSTIDARAAALEAFEVCNLDCQLAAAQAAAGADGADPPLDVAVVRARAAELFASGEGKLNFASGPKLAHEPTLGLVKLAKEARDDLFALHRTEVNTSTGEQLTKEDALGYLLGDVLGLELLPGEARAVGHKATGLLKAAKTRDDALLSGASANARLRVTSYGLYLIIVVISLFLYSF